MLLTLTASQLCPLEIGNLATLLAELTNCSKTKNPARFGTAGWECEIVRTCTVHNIGYVLSDGEVIDSELVWLCLVAKVLELVNM